MSFIPNLFCGGVWYISVSEVSLKSALKIIRLYVCEISSCLWNGYLQNIGNCVFCCVLIQHLKDKVLRLDLRVSDLNFDLLA